jgi:hypothetical protein
VDISSSELANTSDAMCITLTQQREGNAAVFLMIRKLVLCKVLLFKATCFRENLQNRWSQCYCDILNLIRMINSEPALSKCNFTYFAFSSSESHLFLNPPAKSPSLYITQVFCAAVRFRLKSWSSPLCGN